MSARRRVQQKTLLIVSEGPSDKAFVDHLKHLFDYRENNQRTTIKSSNGGSPGDIVKCCVNHCRTADFDRKIVILDSDIPIEQTVKNLANQKQIILLQSEPICLECMLLQMLNENVPATCAMCKSALENHIPGRLTDKLSYRQLFTQQLLEQSAPDCIKTIIEYLKHE